VVCDRDAESNRNGAPKEPPLSPDNRAAPARDDRSARIRTRTSEVGARRASGYTTDLNSSVFLARRCVPICRWDSGSHTARRQEGAQRREAARGARLRRAGAGCRPGKRERTTWIEQASSGWRPVALPSELRPPMRPAGVEPARVPYQSTALH
jgi:hypothetical protein